MPSPGNGNRRQWRKRESETLYRDFVVLVTPDDEPPFDEEVKTGVCGR